jgi:UDP-N-acetylmuramyl pentapeptide phosphotransferase/UDP-N-acetylglucosamine-1-phosphate transferase
MPSNMIYVAIIPVFFLAFIAYLKIANHYNIIDKPNERSSHSQITIRGGGVIYLVAAAVAAFLHHSLWMPVLALFTIGIISFADDRMTLSSRLRIIFHLIAVTIIFYYLHIFQVVPWWVVAALYVLVIGVINAYNFMDGINGITGTYSLVVLAGLQYVNLYVAPFITSDMIWLPILATCVFLFFNFRVKAKCFAGDVGSITVALWIVYLLATLILKTEDFSYILFLAVYGVDAVLTIMHRLVLGQNIFQPHRLHFYQILANDCKISHLKISVAYGAVQLAIIVFVIFSGLGTISLILVITVPLVVVYMFFKPRLMLRTASS